MEEVIRKTQRRRKANEMHIKLDIFIDETPGNDEAIKKALRNLFDALNQRGAKLK